MQSTDKGRTIMAAMKKQYGEKKSKSMGDVSKKSMAMAARVIKMNK